MRGLVESVFTEPVGSDVVADSTGTVVTVDEGAVFVNATQVQIADVEYGLLSVDGDELTLDDSVTVEVGEQVFVFPFLPERLALVSVDDGETVSARVPHALSALLADGDRVDVDREVVVLGSDDAGYFVSDVLTRNPQIEASLLVGELPAGMGTGDVEPSYSPIPVTRGGLGLILVSWEPVVNASPVVYDVYMGASPGFTADSSSLLQSTAASMISVRALPDGTVLSYDTDYFFKLVARSGVLAAAESVEVAGRMDRAGSADIVAGSVTAEKLASTIVLAGEIATASSGARVRLSAGQGLEGFGSAGDTVFHLPVVPDEDGNLVASVKADAVLRSATVEDRLSVRGQGNEFSKGSLVTLATGTTAPQVSPSASVQWPNKPVTGGRNFFNSGFHYDSGSSSWWSTTSLFGSTWVEQHVEGSNSFAYSNFFQPSGYLLLSGVTVIGGNVYVLAAITLSGISTWQVREYTTTGTLLNTWTYSTNAATATIGTNGTNLLIAHGDGSGNTLRIKEYTTTGSLVNTVTTTTPVTGRLTGVLYGSFDFGANRYVLANTEWPEIRVYNATGTRQTNDEFLVPTVGVDGLGWDSSNNTFVTTVTQTVYRHTNLKWSGATTRRQWVAHSWFDSNSGGTGQHETLISEPQSYTMSKRAAFTITTPPLPSPDPVQPLDSVTGVRVYHGVGDTKPVASAMYRESIDLANGVTSKQYLTLNATLPANTGTPTGFGASTPATIRSSDSPASITLNGDGTAKLDKVVSLKDSATSTVWLNAAGTGRLQKPVILVANRNATTLNVANNTITYFNDTHHDISVNQGGFTRTSVSSQARYFVPQTGLYRITYRAGFVANATSRRGLQVSVAGVPSGYFGSQATGTGSWSGVLNTYIEISNPTDEYLEFTVQQNSGGSLATQTELNAGGQIVIERISD